MRQRFDAMENLEKICKILETKQALSSHCMTITYRSIPRKEEANINF